MPGLINYQGRVTVGTTNFNSPPNGLFKFVLTNSAGTYYWTNDGSVTQYGSQPTNAVSLTVSKGLYSVLLGDTSIANMTAIPASVWANPDVRLRVWFDDGVNGSQLVSPDQRLAPNGYLADGSVTSAKIANGLTLAGTTTISGNLALPNTTSASTGVVTLGGNPFLHDAGDVGSLFAGANAGNFTLTGTDNTASGYETLFHDTTGSHDTASGFEALYRNTTGSNNTASGESALFNNTSGSGNTASGIAALFANTTGGLNTALGFFAGGHLTSGSNNIDIGNYNPNTQTSSDVAGESNIIRIGDGVTQTDTYLTGRIHGGSSGLTLSDDLNLPATSSASVGVINIGGNAFLHAYGQGGLASDQNTFVGYNAGNFTLSGLDNTGIGSGALHSDTSGHWNTAVGLNALYANTTGNLNTAVGYTSLRLNSTASSNTAVGYQALNQITTGGNNIGVGNNGGFNLDTGSNNIDIGNQGVAGESNIIRIGDGSTQTDIYLTGLVHAAGSITSGSATLSGGLTAGSTSAGINLNGRTGIGSAPQSNVALNVKRFAAGEFAANFQREDNANYVQIGGGSTTLFANRATGTIFRSDFSSSWDTSSDIRIKHDVVPVTGALETLARLRPVRFHYNADFLAKMPGATDYERYGVVAQEFQKVFPDYVDGDADGMLSVRMDPIPIVTAAAVQELNAKVNERDARIEALEKENRALEQKDKTIEARLQALEARLAPANP